MKKLGKYTIVERVGKGTMGVVYRAHDETLGEIAIKFLSADLCNEPLARDRFIREARIAASLNHRNIIDIHGMGEQDGRPYIVMEFLEGDSLKALITRGDEVPLEYRLELMKQVAGALAYAHCADVAHRDIKPDNIFVTRNGDVRLLDFGIARIKNSTMTATGVALGTPAYMAPEQVVGKKVDRRADVFAAGTVFYELLTGERAFKGSVHEIFDKVITHQPAPIHRLNDLLPKELSAIIHKAMAKPVEQRYQSMDEMLAHLERFDASLARLRDEVRQEAEAGAASLGKLRSGIRRPGFTGANQLPDGYLALHAFVRGLAGEHTQTGALKSELDWVTDVSAASLGEYTQTDLRNMANRVDEIRDACPEEDSGVTRLGRRLLDELKARLRPARELFSDPEATGSGDFALRT